MENKTSESQFDVICIGSGMGCQTVASLLAQFAQKKVLIIEKHFQAGGYTHSFSRKSGKFHWDVGIHYVGDMHEGGFGNKLMGKITGGGTKWQRMAEPFEKFVYPTGTFNLYGDVVRFKADLLAKFPHEAVAIERYFDDIRKLSAIFGKSMMLKNRMPSLKSITITNGESELVTVKDYLDHFFKDAELRAILASQWGDYGLPPSKCAFATHAALVVHYFNGGYYPVGGGGKIFESVQPIVEAAGGKILTTTEVSEVLIEDGKAVGVKATQLRGAKETTDYYAPVIVSGVGAYPTYKKLIPESVAIPFRDELQQFYNKEKMATSVCVYMGLSSSPAALGFKGENYWIFESLDHEEVFAERNAWLTSEAEIRNLYLSFPSLKDPEAKGHTADMITFTDYSLFEQWKDLPWKKRGEEYAKFKEHIGQKVIAAVDKRFPGFKDIVEYVEVSTPITNEHFTSHPDGAIYGLACVPERYEHEKTPWFEVQTPVEGLMITGADAGGSPGIAGAMMGGLATTLRILGNRDLLRQVLA
jgi:all-trans-retinol 13,14-reductase